MSSFLTLWINVSLIFFSLLSFFGDLIVYDIKSTNLKLFQDVYSLIPNDTQIYYTYGKDLQINTSLELLHKISELNNTLKPKEFILFLQPSNRNDPWRIPLKAQTQDKPNKWKISYSHDIKEKPIPLFSITKYWFGIILENDQLVISHLSSFVVEDNRFTWQALEGNYIKVFWFQGTLTYAQEIYNITLETLTLAKNYININYPEQINLYLYPNKETLLHSLNYSAIKSFSDLPQYNLSAIILYSPNNKQQKEENIEQLTRQLSSILLRSRLMEKYRDFPFWLKEGFATLINPYADNTQNQEILAQAYHRNSLVPFEGLCRSFPRDPIGYKLAKTQSSSFINFLIRTQGKDIIEKIIQAFTVDNNCLSSFEKATSVPLTQIENRWKKELFITYHALEESQPHQLWLLFLVLIMLIPIFQGLFIFSNHNK